MTKYFNWLYDFFKYEKCNIFYVFWVTFIVPVFFLKVINIESDKIICLIFQSFIFSVLIYCSSIFIPGTYKKIYFILILIVFYLPGVIVLSTIELDKSILKGTDFWFIFQSNPKESGEFVSTYFTWKIASLILIYTVVPVYLLLTGITMASTCSRRKHVGLPGAAVFVILSCFSYSVRASDYVIDFYKSFYEYHKELKLYDSHLEDRAIKANNVSFDLPDSIHKTFIVIIGESLTRRHMSLYGYSRKTNPLLENIKNELLIFNNVISSDLQTSPSLKKALTFANSEFPGYYYQKPSIIEIFNALNFHTSWIDNQYYRLDDKSPDIYMKIAELSKEFVNLNFAKPDESVLEPLKNILGRKSEANKLIVIHLMGSHLPYKIRYPDSFSKFTGVNGISSKVKDQLKMNQVEIINEYDNSVLYNDFVISSIINLVKGKGGLSYIIYFSDHGEEVFDEKVYSGRSFDNITPDMCQIPFILWLSDEYKKQRPLNINLERSYSIEDVIHTILDLSFINQADYDSTRSLVSDYFTERVRCVNGKNYSKIPQ